MEGRKDYLASTVSRADEVEKEEGRKTLKANGAYRKVLSSAWHKLVSDLLIENGKGVRRWLKGCFESSVTLFGESLNVEQGGLGLDSNKILRLAI